MLLPQICLLWPTILSLVGASTVSEFESEFSDWLSHGEVSMSNLDYLFKWVPQTLVKQPSYNRETSFRQLARLVFNGSPNFERPQVVDPAVVQNADNTHQALAHFWRLGGIERNFTLALKLFEEAAAKGDGYAMFMCGVIHSTGLFGHVPRSPAKALIYYTMGSKAGNAEASIALGMKYKLGQGVVKDEDIALKHLQAAGDIVKEHIDNSSLIYTRQGGTYWSLAAESGNGLYGERAYSRINENTRSQISQGKVSPAKRFLDSAFQTAPSSLHSALEELEYRCYEEKDVTSMFALSQVYALGAVDGTTIPDWTSAVNYARMCLANSRFDQHDKFAVNEVVRSKCLEFLGNRYMRGEGVKVDVERAIKLYTQAQQSRNGVNLCEHCQTNILVANYVLQNGTYEAAYEAVQKSHLASTSTSGIDYTLPMLALKVAEDKSNVVELLRVAITSSLFRAPAASLALCRLDDPEKRIRRCYEGLVSSCDIYSPSKAAHYWLSQGDLESAMLALMIASELGTPTAAANLGDMLDVLHSYWGKKFSLIKKLTEWPCPFVKPEDRPEQAFYYFSLAAKKNSMDSMVKCAEYGMHNSSFAADYEIDKWLDSASKFNFGMAHLMKAIRAHERGANDKAVEFAKQAGICPELWIPARVLRLKIRYGMRLIDVPVALLLVCIALYYFLR